MYIVDPNSLTPAQQIFSVFYAIFFGTMLQTIGARRSINHDKKNPYKKTKVSNASLTLFDTPNAFAIGWVKNNKPLWRLLISIIFLNFVPGAIFAIVFNLLNNINRPLTFIDIIIVVWLSLAPQQLYRIFYAFLVRFDNKIYLTGIGEDKKLKEYSDYDIAALAMLWEDRKQFVAHSKALNHLAFPLFFYFPTFLLALCILVKIDLTLHLSLYLLVCGLVLFFLNKPKID